MWAEPFSISFSLCLILECRSSRMDRSKNLARELCVRFFWNASTPHPMLWGLGDTLLHTVSSQWPVLWDGMAPGLPGYHKSDMSIQATQWEPSITQHSKYIQKSFRHFLEPLNNLVLGIVMGLSKYWYWYWVLLRTHHKIGIGWVLLRPLWRYWVLVLG